MMASLLHAQVQTRKLTSLNPPMQITERYRIDSRFSYMLT